MREEFKKLKGSKVLVTGGAGFIGFNLREALLSLNAKVSCLDNFSTGHRKNIEDLFEFPDFTLIEGYICEINTCKQAAVGQDYILYEAALGSVPRFINNPINSNEVNVPAF